MRKIFTAVALLALSISASSQTTCETREGKLLESLGSFSAAALLNTHSLSSAVHAAHEAKIYTDLEARNKFSVIKVLAETLAKNSRELVSEKSLKDEPDVIFVEQLIEVLDGLKKSSEYYLDYIESKSSISLKSYKDQEAANWTNISDLLGLDDEEDED